MISVAAELVGMHPQTLRIYENKGLVRPGRTPGGTRLYSERDLDRLRLIQRLTTELGLNLAGVERVIALEDELAQMRARFDRLERGDARGDRAGAPPVPPRPRALPRARALPGQESGTDGLQQADDQVARRRSPPRRSARAASATPSSTPSTCCSRCSTRSCRARSSGRAEELRSSAEARLAPEPAASRARSSSRSVSAALSKVLDRAVRRGEEARGRLRLDRAPAARARRRPARRSCSRRSRRCAAASASPRRIPRAPTRRWRSSAAT